MEKGMLLSSFTLKERKKRNADFFSLNKDIKCKTNENDYIYDSISNIINDFCLENIENYNDEKHQKIFSIKKDSLNIKEYDTSECFSFIIKSGNYGIPSDITNVKTNEVKFHKTKEDADIKEFICLIYIPKDFVNEVKKGIIIFESIGSFGIKMITCQVLTKFLSNKGITFETKSISPDAFLQKLLRDGSIKNITYTINNVSGNSADNILGATGTEKRAILNPRFSDLSIEKLTNWFNKKKENSDMKICEISDISYLDDISLSFRLGDKSRTIKLATLDKLSIVEEIPKGYNSDDQIVNYMKETADSYREYIICN